ncbi:lysophospholipid acyltransferase family protein [Maribacter chungangensis]|uniref:Lysophospholipid acyltransferase family protein n=1 Tax=Maribacter chungangensis TaxID=1069117 RepID=A0ABW3B2R9_9FLAO
MLYRALKNIIHIGLYCYHSRILVYGLENIPKNKPVLFLPNHQNALIDVLLVAVNCNRKPYFLARSDIFGGRVLNVLFEYVRMIPIYRMRDGRNTLSKNDAVFDSCARVLSKGEAIVMFPEGNHNLKRRVRPLSKGFTRVLFRALEQSPELDIQVVPVGLNYTCAENFPSSAAVYYGKPIAIQDLYDKEDLPNSVVNIKEAVAFRLKTLTTHISPEVQYNEIASYLETQKVSFLDPEKTNRLIREGFPLTAPKVEKTRAHTNENNIFKSVFLFLNFPVILFWKLLIRPRVPETEFIGTFRFAWSFVGFMLYFSLLFVLFLFTANLWWALGTVFFLWMFNVGYVKFLSN